MTFNIHHGGIDRIFDLKRIAVLIKTSGADIIGLQAWALFFSKESVRFLLFQGFSR
ncbi:endonuclease/exonuclease/phosphatase family protein [Neobacillus niacini]|uniref:endonuclease/exonuclease/phosphatase family protein n=1 Tax=Neobacillus niacini TaxID=86668 RepID=UPI000ACE1955|nr:hypothetical protein [Neobacillus niacini]